MFDVNTMENMIKNFEKFHLEKEIKKGYW